MPSITLTVVAGPAVGATCSRDSSKPIRVGRIKSGNALVIKDDQVSSKHLEITWSDGDWFALDVGSTNGTKLNESSVRMMDDQRYKLVDGDQLCLGPETVVAVQLQGLQGADAEDAEGQMSVEEKLMADAERLAASIQAAAAAAQQQLRQEWGEQRAVLEAMVVQH